MATTPRQPERPEQARRRSGGAGAHQDRRRRRARTRSAARRSAVREQQGAQMMNESRPGWPRTRDWVLRTLRGENRAGLFLMGMSRSDRRTWHAATTLPELGEITARWLERSVTSHPGTQAGYGPDPETEALVPVLARLCRAGFVTDGSQPGMAAESEAGGASGEQRAAVDAFCTAETASCVRVAAGAAGLLVVDVQPGGWRYDYSSAIAVTRVGEQVVTQFGARPTCRDLRSLRFAECSDAMLDQLCESRAVTVVDPVWGRDDVLWPALEAAVTGVVR